MFCRFYNLDLSHETFTRIYQIIDKNNICVVLDSTFYHFCEAVFLARLTYIKTRNLSLSICFPMGDECRSEGNTCAFNTADLDWSLRSKAFPKKRGQVFHNVGLKENIS